MAKTRALLKRRKAIRNIHKITRTMELIATSRFQRAMVRAQQAAAFTRKITELAADLSLSAVNIDHPLLKKREPTKRAVLLVICSNRGLCGGYNAAILRQATLRYQELRQAGTELELDVSGKRGIAYFRYQGITPALTYTQFEDKPAFEQVEPIADRLIEAYVQEKIDRVDVAYMKFLSPARQTAVAETLLPLASEAAWPTASAASPKREAKVEYEFLPSAREILGEILPWSFKVRLFKCFLDAAVSEQIARRVAMKAATENAADMIKTITRQYNRARQAQITKEIAEVIGGAAALE
ncbi:MAG: ATP synthase F1 subunit gamma [Gemmatales bacterium]|nr:ATP synthase F1 subunit gamma [Gemmatales bacterium]MDW8386965.1 ATP synthase F1 subunit gamma [Gemmatales bacterium]